MCFRQRQTVFDKQIQNCLVTVVEKVEDLCKIVNTGIHANIQYWSQKKPHNKNCPGVNRIKPNSVNLAICKTDLHLLNMVNE